MLKYIGSFDKLKDYGFEYADWDGFKNLSNKYTSTYNGGGAIVIDELTREMKIRFGDIFNQFEIDFIQLDVVSTLIKAGLVIKD